MRDALVVAAREISERKRIFIAAAVASLLPLLAPLIPGTPVSQAPEARGIYALTLAVAFGAGTGIVLGATIVAQELAERRISFFFSRPISSLAIWGGKTLAAWLLSIGVGVLCLLPALGMGLRVSFINRDVIANLAACGLLGLLFLVVLFEAASVAVRSRSPWLIVDVVLLGVCAFLAARSFGHLALSGFLFPVAGPLVCSGLGLLALLLVAGAVQMAVGRGDLRRGHGAQSLVIWSVALPMALAGAGVTAWLLSPTPNDLVRIDGGLTAPKGDWVRIEGLARYRRTSVASFLFDARSGRSIALPVFFLAGWPTRFSLDGKMALIDGLSGDPDAPWRLLVANLEAPQPRLQPTNLVFDEISESCLSPSGNRVAVRSKDVVSVIDFSTERTVAATKLDSLERFFFEDEDTIRLFRTFVPSLDKVLTSVPLYEFRIPERKLIKTGKVPRAAGKLLQLRYDLTRGQLITLENDRTRLSLRDGLSGELLQILSDGPRLSQFLPLASGRIAATEAEDGHLRLHQFDANSGMAKPIDLGEFRRAALLGEISVGRLLVAAGRGPDKGPPQERFSTLLLVDLTTGTVRRQEEGLAPLSPWEWFFSPTLPPATVFGPPRTKYFLDEKGALVFYDAATGERRQILPKPR